MSPTNPLEQHLPAFWETFECPACHRGDFGRREPIARHPAAMVISACPCGMEITFLFDFEAKAVVWRCSKTVVVHRRPWLMTYQSWADRTWYQRGDTEHEFAGFLPAERFEKLLVVA